MKEKVCCVLDLDENYAIRLTDRINEKKLLPYPALAFTSQEAVRDCGNEYEIELLLVGDFVGEKGELEAKNIIFLTESRGNTENEQVFRYQPAEYLIRDVMARLSGVFKDYARKNENLNIKGVYSPAGGCGKTTFSLALAHYLSEKQKVLYLSLEQFSGLAGLLSQERGGMSDALYYYRADRSSSYGKILSCMDEQMGFEYLYPVICAEDISDIGSKDLCDFIKLIADGGKYTELVVDFGNIVNNPWELMNICSVIYVPEFIAETETFSAVKVQNLREFLSSTGWEYLMKKIKTVEIPFAREYFNSSVSREIIESRLYRELCGRYVNE